MLLFEYNIKEANGKYGIKAENFRIIISSRPPGYNFPTLLYELGVLLYPKEKSLQIFRFEGLKLADQTGLEPATSAVTGRHSNQLNY